MSALLGADARLGSGSGPPTVPRRWSLLPKRQGDTTALVGLWDVSGDGIEPGLVLSLGRRSEVIGAEGQAMGGWAASDDALSIGLYFGSGARGQELCSVTSASTRWWLRVRLARALGAAPKLLDGEDRLVARLALHAGVPPDESMAAHEPPLLTPELRQRLSAPAGLPAGLRAPTPGELEGRWVDADVHPRRSRPSGGAARAAGLPRPFGPLDRCVVGGLRRDQPPGGHVGARRGRWAGRHEWRADGHRWGEPPHPAAGMAGAQGRDRRRGPGPSPGAARRGRAAPRAVAPRS